MTTTLQKLLNSSVVLIWEIFIPWCAQKQIDNLRKSHTQQDRVNSAWQSAQNFLKNLPLTYLGIKAFAAWTTCLPDSQFSTERTKAFICLRPVSNWGPFTCKANVMTSTLRKPATKVVSDLFNARLLEHESNYRLPCAVQSANTFYF